MHISIIIKPHAFEQKAAIIEALREAGIRKLDGRHFLFGEKVVSALYSNMGEASQKDIVEYFGDKQAYALLVEAPSVDCVLEVTGDEGDPARCALNTIRHRFGRHAPPVYVGGVEWWDNAVHRPTNDAEVHRDLAAVFGWKIPS